jgi:amino acid permease
MTPTFDHDRNTQEPLLPSPSSSSSSLGDSEADNHSIKLSRHVENTVLPETAILGRNLSWSSAYILVISRVIGSGIFATPGSIVKTTGSIGLAMLLWIGGSFIAWCGLVISLEYGCMLPRSGGDKVYLEFTYQHPRFFASTLIAVHAVLLGFTASNCIIFGEYVLFAFGVQPTEFLQKSLALGLLTAITIVHGCFLETGIRIQNFLGWIKVGLILFMALTGVFVVLFDIKGSEVPKTLLSWDGLWKDSNWGWGTLSTAIFKVSYSYAGLTNVNNVLNEVKDPVRTLKTVAPAALFTSCFLYLLVNFAYFTVVPLQEVKDSGEMIAALFFERVFGDNFGKIILPLAIAISAAGNVMVVTFTLVSSTIPPISWRNSLSLLTPRKSPQELTRTPGPRKPRNSPARLPPLFTPPLLLQTLRCPPRRSNRALHPVPPRNPHPSARGRLQLHPRRRGVPRSISRPRNRHRSSSPPTKETRSQKTV